MIKRPSSYVGKLKICQNSHCLTIMINVLLVVCVCASVKCVWCLRVGGQNTDGSPTHSLPGLFSFPIANSVAYCNSFKGPTILFWNDSTGLKTVGERVYQNYTQYFKRFSYTICWFIYTYLLNYPNNVQQ